MSVSIKLLIYHGEACFSEASCFIITFNYFPNGKLKIYYFEMAVLAYSSVTYNTYTCIQVLSFNLIV